MATRQQLRTGLQRMVHDISAEHWSAADCNEALNESLQSIQELIMALDPEAFVVWQTRDVVANQRSYLRPVDIVYDIELGYSDTPAANEYAPLTRVPYRNLRDVESGRAYAAADQAGQYAKVGKYYYLGWNPDNAIVEGLQTTYIPWLSMDDDNDVPALSIGYHRMVKVDAAIKLLSETPEDTTHLERERAEFFEKLTKYYRSSATTPDLIEMDLSGLKSY